MTKSELDTLDSVFLAPLALFVNQYFGTIFSERKLLWICMVRFFFIMISLYRYHSSPRRLAGEKKKVPAIIIKQKFGFPIRTT